MRCARCGRSAVSPADCDQRRAALWNPAFGGLCCYRVACLLFVGRSKQCPVHYERIVVALLQIYYGSPLISLFLE